MIREQYDPHKLDGMNLHTLIAGVSGSGKSTLVRTILNQLSLEPDTKFVLIDPKRTELMSYRRSLKTLWYATSMEDIYDTLCMVECLMDSRFDKMCDKGQTNSDEDHVFVVVDEMAFLMQGRQKRQYVELFNKIALMGRAARVHLILCTQVSTQDVIPACIRDNMANIVALRQRDDGKYRYLLGCAPGRLPKYGFAYVLTPDMGEPERVSTSNVWYKIQGE